MIFELDALNIHPALVVSVMIALLGKNSKSIAFVLLKK